MWVRILWVLEHRERKKKWREKKEREIVGLKSKDKIGLKINIKYFLDKFWCLEIYKLTI